MRYVEHIRVTFFAATTDASCCWSTRCMPSCSRCSAMLFILTVFHTLTSVQDDKQRIININRFTSNQVTHCVKWCERCGDSSGGDDGAGAGRRHSGDADGPSALIRNSFRFCGRGSAGIGACTRRTRLSSRTMGTARASGVALFLASFSTVFYFRFTHGVCLPQECCHGPHQRI